MHSRTDRPETAALIVAAGMSSRMGDFKPMLTIGEMSIAERVITTFQQAGVTRIVVVTGYQAELLERHLAGREVVFLRNERYRETQMFDSACIGLQYLRGKCDRVLFTPRWTSRSSPPQRCARCCGRTRRSPVPSARAKRDTRPCSPKR